MSNIYYRVQMMTDNRDYDFVGIFTTRKNAEAAIYNILSKRYNVTAPYPGYSIRTDFLNEHSDEYTIDRIEVDKNYY